MSRRILIGAFPDSGYGLRVSQPGYDVTSNPVDDSKLFFNSDWTSAFPIYLQGALNVPSGTATTYYYTNLGYAPFGEYLIQNAGIYESCFNYPHYKASFDTKYVNVGFYADHLRVYQTLGVTLTILYTIFKIRAI